MFKPNAFLLALLLALCGEMAVVGQDFPANTVQSVNSLPGKNYPRIYEDGRVIFQVKAPDTREVTSSTS